MHHLEEHLKDLQKIEEKHDKAFTRLKYNTMIICALWIIIVMTIILYSI